MIPVTCGDYARVLCLRPPQGDGDSVIEPLRWNVSCRSSKRLAQKLRIFQPVSPGQLDCLGEADPQPGDDIRLARAGMQRDRGSIQRQAVMLITDPERFRQLART